MLIAKFVVATGNGGDGRMGGTGGRGGDVGSGNSNFRTQNFENSNLRKSYTIRDLSSVHADES